MVGRGIGDFLEKDLCQHTVPPRTAALSAPDPVPGHCQPTPPLETPKTLIDKSDSVSFGVTAPFSWVLEHIRKVFSLQEAVSLVLCKFWNQILLTFKVTFPENSQFLCRIFGLGSLL